MGDIKVVQLKSKSLQEVFKKEDEGFTPWLAANLNRLAVALGIPEMVKQRTEVTLNSLRPDIVAYTDPTEGEAVIIENQYGKSDSGHVGKLLSYAAYQGAKYAILICEDARIEHIKAIEALNDKNVCGCNFYLVLAKCYQIENSPNAIKFEVIVQPKVQEDEKEETETMQTLRQFWTEFIKQAQASHVGMYANRKPSKEHWLDGYIGKSDIHFISRIRKDGCSIALWFGSSDSETNTKNYNTFLLHKESIEKSFGDTLLWEDDPTKKMCKIEYSISGVGGYNNRDKWPTIIDTMLIDIKGLNEAVKPYLH